MIRNRLIGMLAGVVAAAAVMGSTLTVYAETAISRISVRVTDNYDSEGGELLEPTVTVSGGGITVSDVSWSKERDKWKPGNKVTATVALSADEGKSFFESYTTSNSNRKISVSGANFSSAKRDEDGSLIVKFTYYPVVQLGLTERAGWSNASKTTAVWKKVPYATAYQVRLYSGDDSHVKTLTLEGNTVDLSQYITKETNYFYEVRATAKDSSDAKHIKSGEYVTSTDNFMEDIGEVGGRWQTLKDGYKYKDEQGMQAVNGWRYIKGEWYYFNENGYAVTGWYNVGGKWYYMNSDCKMQIGWLNLDNVWYYTDPTGAMVTGWYQTTPTDWYYFYENGVMASNTVIEGRTLTESGRMQ